MPRIANEKYRIAKKSKILDGARLVFCRRGYLNVTMQDIIDECEISRGGIYLYFSSVDEIFREVLTRRNKEKFSAVHNASNDNEPFEDVLNNYMTLQRERLLNIENSLLRATYEYIFSGTDGAIQLFRDEQLGNLRKSVQSILMLGIRQKVLRNENIPGLTDHFIVVIDGLGILALAGVLTEKIVDAQFAILNGMIENIKMR